MLLGSAVFLELQRGLRKGDDLEGDCFADGPSAAVDPQLAVDSIVVALDRIQG